MKPLADWPLEARQRITGVLTDIDDTLTTQGAITADALQALHDLTAAGLVVIPITGRPLGWSEPFAGQVGSNPDAAWPVPAIVAENGAAAVLSNQTSLLPPYLLNSLLSKAYYPVKIYQQDAATRASNFARMQTAAAQILAQVAGAQLSQDHGGRETDLAIDHSEFVHLDAPRIAQVVDLMRTAGMNATVSSIHINGWYGEHNKLQGARWIVQRLFGRDLFNELPQWAYVGDSTNDQLMFERFDNSVGVANIRRFESELAHKPRYITLGERGAGFAEVARALLQARKGRP
jgi:HAD superfamily hydrolase (TIGR01484 family)